MIKRTVFYAALAVLASTTLPVKAQTLVVLELFTSQGCSSCPPADALLKQLTINDPRLLPLSLHVHYWDYLGWKDPYSSAGNSARQKGYAVALHDPQIYTPQLIVNGSKSVEGWKERDVREAVGRALENRPSVNVAITPRATNGDLAVRFSTKSDFVGPADIWEICFDRNLTTDVKAGENSGRRLESINNVTRFKRLGSWPQDGTNDLILEKRTLGDGVAVIVQTVHEGPILGSAVYYKIHDF